MADEVIRAEIIAEDKTGPGVASARRNLSNLQRDLSGGAQGFNSFRAASMSAASSMSTFTAGLAGAGVVIGAMGLAKLAGGIVSIGRGALQSYADFERLSMSINALAAKEALLTGQASSMQQALSMTSGKSKELLDWIQKLAIESPFRQEDVAQAFRLSMALGFSTSEAQRLTQAMLNFSTATGAGGETMERISRALGQMRTKGRVSLEEINQLTESGVDAMRILSDATGLTGKALTDSISKGLVSADDAINAIIADTERLYSGAGKASAESMTGLLSTLSEIGELSSRNLFSGMFKEAQPYISSVVGILMAPEFQAGITAWGEKIGGFTAEGLQSAADAVERIDAAITPLLNAGAPPWLVALQGLATAGDYQLDVKISPEVTTIKTPDGGLTVDVTATATTITSKDGGLFKVDAEAQIVSIDADTKDSYAPVQLVGKWEEGTIGSLIAAAQTESAADGNKVLLTAGWKDEPATIAQTLVDGLRGYMEVNPVNIGFEAGANLRKSLDSFSWEEYTAKWKPVFDSWSPIFKPIAEVDWGDEFSKNRTVNAQLGSFDWGALWTVVRLVNAALATFDWGGLWDKVYTVKATVKRTYEDVNPYPIYGPQMGVRNTAGSGLGGWDNPGWDDDVRAYYGDAIGDGFFRGGLAMVGEAGPELVVLPRGAQVFNNRDTKALYGGSIPGFAEGTTQIPNGLRNLLSALGLWVPQTSGPQYGPPTREEAFGTWRKIEQKGTEAMQGAAKKAGDAFESAAKKTSDVFKNALQGVPGLFGRSQVTADQMKLAEMGVPQNFADNWLRRLNDEVLNGVEWGDDVDIKDAARRAGVDPNLPNEIILELVNQAWSNGSFFANPANLDRIDMGAAKASMEQQQKEMQGKQNLLGLFGISDENLQQQIDALGGDIANIFGGAAESDAVKGAGAQVFGSMMSGFSDSNTANAGVADMAQSIRTAAGTPENQQLLYDGGVSAYGSWLHGWKAAASEAPVVPPSGTAPIGPQLPPGRAVGVGYWYGGWMTVHANETVYAPRGTSVRTAREGAERGQTVINNYVTVNRPLDEESLLARLARRVQRGY